MFKATLRKGVAKERRISIEDAQMRHGRKSRRVRVDGDIRHVLHDLESGLVRAVGITAANAPEASVTETIMADLACQQVVLGELHIDRAYLSSVVVRQRSADLAIYCKSWPVRNGDRFPKTAFFLDWQRERIRCPNQQEMPFEPGGTVHFPVEVCAACPLRERVAVEHTLAHVGHWQGQRARYRGIRKNLFDLRRCAVIQNMHVIARSLAQSHAA